MYPYHMAIMGLLPHRSKTSRDIDRLKFESRDSSAEL